MSQIELLAPAGDKESFIGAINAGANAVYLSGKLFGARKFAKNFSKEEIRELIQYAHIRNVKVFVTINTLIYEDELSSLFAYADYLVASNVDALIVQDIGVINQFVRRYPDTEIHASTQMNAYNLEQVKYLKQIGVSRVILARETSLDVIRKIKHEVDIDIETFVHGALCVSYSGNCLFSSLNGGRSGNRGECAQTCRLKYDMYEDGELVLKDTYLLSTKDLMSFDTMKDVIDSGVMSFKIEGRMKKPEYVIATTRAYREKIDCIVMNKQFDVDKRIFELFSVFNREYTKGYLNNEQPYNINNSFRPNHLGIYAGDVVSYENGKTKIKVKSTFHLRDGFRIIGRNDVGGKIDRILKDGKKVDTAYIGDEVIIDLPKKVYKNDTLHITQNQNLETSLQSYLDEHFDLIPLEGQLISFVGKPLEVYIKTPYSDYITCSSEYIVKQANNPKQTETKLYEQFDKLGDTPFYLDVFSVSTDGVSFVPNSELNKLRRDVIHQLVESLSLYKMKEISLTKETVDTFDQTKEVTVKVSNKEQFEIVNKYNVDTIYVPSHLKNTLMGENVRYYSTRIHDNEDSDLIVDYGQVRSGVSSDQSLNVTNHYSVYRLHKAGVKKVALSLELDQLQIKNLIRGYINNYQESPNVEVIIYTRPTLMVTKYCPVTKGLGINKLNCKMCEKHSYSLKLNNHTYPLSRDFGCTMNVLHHKVINKMNDIKQYRQIGVGNFRVEFTNEAKDKVHEVMNALKKHFLI